MLDKQTLIHLSVPGSIILLGEHAVLKGYGAIVCAINRRIHVFLKPRQDDQIVIRSQLGEHEVNRHHLLIQKPFQFVLSAIQLFQKNLHAGFNLTIESEFSEKIGLGSSAAVTVGMLAAVQYYLEHSFDLKRIYNLGLTIVRQIQGQGSGYDIAASTYGGLFEYQSNPFELGRLSPFPFVSLIYSGYKTPTGDVIKKVAQAEHQDPQKFKRIYEAIGACVKKGKEDIKNQNWRHLGEVFNEQQELMKQLGVSDQTFESILLALKQNSKILGAKISGSGLGDCVVALKSEPKFQPDVNAFNVIDIQIESRGVVNES